MKQRVNERQPYPWRERARQAAWPGLGLLALGALVGWGVSALWPPAPSGPPAATPEEMAREPQRIPDQVVVSDQPELPESTPLLLPATATQLYCRYRFEQAPAGAEVRVGWRRGGQDLGELPLSEHRRERGEVLAGQFTLAPPPPGPGFPPGLYQLSFYAGEEPLGEGSFVVAREAEKVLAQQAPPPGPVRIVSLGTFRALDPQGRPQAPAPQFAPGDRIWAVFTYLGGVKQGRLEVRWLAAGELIPQATAPVEMKGEAGSGYAWLQAPGEGLPEGAYTVEVHLAGNEQALATAGFSVTRTPPPTPGPASVPPAAGARP